KGFSAREIDEAVDELLNEGRLVETGGRTPVLQVDRGVHDMVRDTWLARLGGLSSLLSNLTDAVYGRFFLEDSRAFARTLSFLVRPEDQNELERLFTDVLIPKITALDRRAREEGDGDAVRLSLLWAPFDLISTPIPTGHDPTRPPESSEDNHGSGPATGSTACHRWTERQESTAPTVFRVSTD
ncbi:MAG: hypothetical protein ACI9OJ_005968, partial [Myxococcota bacterium]